MGRKIFLTALILAVSYVLSFARIINVPADYTTIQAGIDASADGDTVLVAPGTYYENINFNGHNVVLGSLFLLTHNESFISSTIINGDSAGSVVAFNSGEDNGATIAGFRITGGFAEFGGGIRCIGSSPVIYCNAIVNNYAYSNGMSRGMGGGIYSSNSNPTIKRNVIAQNNSYCTSNYGGYGAGIYFEYGNSVIDSNTINGNGADHPFGGGYGGGIFCRNSTLVISNNVINGNSSPAGGGIYTELGDGLFYNNRLSGNTGRDWGGAFYLAGDQDPIISNNIITGNNAGTGGAFYITGSHALIINNVIADNTSQTAGAIYVIWSSGGRLINNIIWNNPTTSGGQIIGAFSEVAFSDIQDGWPGEGNINANPLFREGSYRLQSISCGDSVDSPCIDAGKYLITDSLLDCSWGRGTSRSDIGAYGGGDTTYHAPGIVYVPQDFDRIQDAISFSVDGDTVLVQQGNYFERINYYGHNILLGSLYITTGDTSYISSTVLDGESAGPVVSLRNGETIDAMIIGFTIQNGHAGNGGGIICKSSGATIKNNIIRENQADSCGAGVYFDRPILLMDNEICGNHAHLNGGGIFIAWSNNIIKNNTFINNSADSIGGGIFSYYSTSTIDSNVISQNTAGRQGGGIGCTRSNISAKWNTISDNNADSSGGGIALIDNPISNFQANNIISNMASLGGGLSAISSRLNIIDNLFQSNMAVKGGAFYLFGLGSNPGRISGNELRLNHADSAGGGVFCGYSWPLMTGNTFLSNGSFSGGALYCSAANPSVINNLFTSNSASIAGALYLDSTSTPIIRNTIFWDDSADVSREIFADSISRPVFNYCDVQGGWEGEGNIDIDPLFRNISSGDYHLMSIACSDSLDSPCIDMGSPSDFDTLLTCQWGLGTSRSDMGAYGGGNWVPVGIEDQPIIIPQHFSLSQNYPNPFNPFTTISYNLPQSAHVTLEIYDILGRKMEMLVDEEQPAGPHQAVWNAGDRASGIYFYRIQAGNIIETKRMLLLK